MQLDAAIFIEALHRLEQSRDVDTIASSRMVPTYPTQSWRKAARVSN